MPKECSCIIRDDIVIIEENIKKADLIIWATPTRWANVSALMLKVFERLFGFFIEEMPKGTPLKRAANGKKAILVLLVAPLFCSSGYLINQDQL